jgi:hypothetical protein
VKCWPGATVAGGGGGGSQIIGVPVSGGGGAGSQMMGGGVSVGVAGIALAVAVRVGVIEGGGAGSHIIGVVVGGRVLVGGGGAGSHIIGVVVGGRGVVGGGGAGSQMGGDNRQAVLVPPKTITMARMAFCRSLGSLLQGIMGGLRWKGLSTDFWNELNGLAVYGVSNLLNSFP